MRGRWKRVWPILKVVLAVAILVAVGRHIARDLGSVDLGRQPLRPGWLVLAGLLYLPALGFSALYWYRLLREMGQRPSPLAVARAYYVGHLGKYLPGKAWALLIRATMAAGHGVRLGIAALTSFYEVLTTMASGVLAALVLFLFLIPDRPAGIDWQTLGQMFTRQTPDLVQLDREVLVLVALVLLVPLGLAILPPIFNRLVRRMTLPFQRADGGPPPSIRLGSMFEGLAVTSIGWLLLGISLWATLQAVMEEPPPWTWDTLGRCTAYLAVAYVAGFLIPIPGGLGVREFCLTVFLLPEVVPLVGENEKTARAVVALTVVLLRLAWTAVEVPTASALYLMYGRTVPEAER